MATAHLFRYRCRNGTPILMDDEPAGIQPPDELPDWQCSDERGIAVLYVTRDSGSPTDATIELDLSPAIIKGWKIYTLENTRITDGGMINDRQVTLAVTGLEPHERRRMDILFKGPPGRMQVTTTQQ